MPPKLPDLSRLFINDPHREDNSYEVNSKRLKRAWAARSSPSERVCELGLEEATQKLVSILKEKMKANVLLPLKRAPCARGFEFPRSQEKLLKLLEHDANFERQHCTQFSGGEFHNGMDLKEVQSLVIEYKKIWPDTEPEQKNGVPNLDTDSYNVKDKIINLVMEKKDMFLPMIHALIAAGYAESISEFQLMYRFQSVRHKAAAVYHMDYNNYQTYADDGFILDEWTKSGQRAVVTSACIDMSPNNAGPSMWHNCGTKVALGVPILRPSALNELMKVVSDESEALGCKTARTMRNKVTTHLMDATEFALIEFERQGFSLESAGVKELVLENGVIADYHDTMFHKANIDIPPGYSRVFFVMGCGKTTAKRSTKIIDTQNGQTYNLFITPI